MTHLLAGLLRHHDPGLFALVVMEALLGCAGAAYLLRWPPGGTTRQPAVAMLFGLVVALASWAAFLTALSGTFPKLSLAVPLSWAVPAVTMSLASSVAAGAIQQLARRSARNAMFAGSLLACGFSCMLLIGMAGLVQPFMLGYDLTAVLAVMCVGAALCGFALLEIASPHRPYAWPLATILGTLAILVLAFGSLAAILPFEDWIETVGRPDNLASSPIAIVIATEALGVLAFGLSGSLVDNRLAARDRQESDRFRQMADSAFEGILIHCGNDILDGNASLVALLGLDLAELRASPITRFIGRDNVALWDAEHGEATQTQILVADGSSRPVEILTRSINYRGRTALVTALRDVRERQMSEARIHFLAHHDMLTELPNRVLLGERLEKALKVAARGDSTVAVLCLDLDGFKLVNDTLGHPAGDQLLRQVAGRLTANVRATDLVARFGGDEFIVLQTAGTPPEQAHNLARRIVECLAPSFRIDGKDVSVGVSIGIAVYPADGDTSTALMKNADIALYHAKKKGRGWFFRFEHGMDQALRDRRDMEQDLRVALRQGDFTLCFQPLFDRDLGLVAFEALLRWTHPLLGPISPGDFIPLAEACGCIVPLGEWVLRTACIAALGWDQPCRVAVNLSPSQILRGNVRSTVAAILEETGLDPGRLELEITEGVLMEDTTMALTTLQDLRELGVRLVLDDFGTGYSSLSYLQRFAFHKLKVDRSFVNLLEIDTGTRAIVHAIIVMSEALGIDVTAEGVETRAQYDLLRIQGCHEFQGFLFGTPLLQHQVGPFMHDRNTAGVAMRDHEEAA